MFGRMLSFSWLLFSLFQNLFASTLQFVTNCFPNCSFFLTSYFVNHDFNHYEFVFSNIRKYSGLQYESLEESYERTTVEADSKNPDRHPLTLTGYGTGVFKFAHISINGSVAIVDKVVFKWNVSAERIVLFLSSKEVKFFKNFVLKWFVLIGLIWSHL